MVYVFNDGMLYRGRRIMTSKKDERGNWVDAGEVWNTDGIPVARIYGKWNYVSQAFDDYEQNEFFQNLNVPIVRLGSPVLPEHVA